jgi:hypothetical protein
MGDRNDGTVSYSHTTKCYIAVHSFLAYVNQTKVFLSNEGYVIVLPTNIRVTTERHIEKYAGRGILNVSRDIW